MNHAVTVGAQHRKIFSHVIRDRHPLLQRCYRLEMVGFDEALADRAVAFFKIEVASLADRTVEFFRSHQEGAGGLRRSTRRALPLARDPIPYSLCDLLNRFAKKTTKRNEVARRITSAP